VRVVLGAHGPVPGRTALHRFGRFVDDEIVDAQRVRGPLGLDAADRCLNVHAFLPGPHDALVAAVVRVRQEQLGQQALLVELLQNRARRVRVLLARNLRDHARHDLRLVAFPARLGNLRLIPRALAAVARGVRVRGVLHRLIARMLLHLDGRLALHLDRFALLAEHP
jgi:hypothetical protein